MTDRSPTAFMKAVRFTNTKTGSSAQKSVLKTRSRPGHSKGGRLTHRASATMSAS